MGALVKHVHLHDANVLVKGTVANTLSRLNTDICDRVVNIILVTLLLFALLLNLAHLLAAVVLAVIVEVVHGCNGVSCNNNGKLSII